MAEPNGAGGGSREPGPGGEAGPGDLAPSAAGESWPERIEELLGEAEAAPTTADRIALLCRVAEIYERRLGDPPAALVTLQAALEQDPTSGRVVQEMERVARNTGCWAELAAVTAEVASGLEDSKQAADLWVQIAFWDESGLGMLDEAAKAANAALALRPDHGGALALLEELYRRQRSWDDYVAILAKKRGGAHDDLYKLGDAYREVLRFEPRHAGALDALAALHEELGEWERAAEVLGRLIAALDGGERLLSARHRLGRLLKDRLADPRGAEEQLALALAMPEGTSHVPSLLALSAIYRDRGDWLKARQLLGRAATAAEDPDLRVRLLVEAAEICADKLDDEVQASQLYDEAIAIDPTRTDVVDKLAAIRFRRGDWGGLLPLAEFLVSKAEGPWAPRPEPEPVPTAEPSSPASEPPSPAVEPAATSERVAAAPTDVPGQLPVAVSGEIVTSAVVAPERKPTDEGAPTADSEAAPSVVVAASVAVPADGAPVDGTHAPPPGPAPSAAPAAEPPEPKKTTAERARLWYQLARALEETGDAARARHAYLAAIDVHPAAPDSLAPRRDFAAFSYRREAWADAAGAYEALLGEHASSLRRPDVVDFQERLGLSLLRAGEPARALAAFEKVLALEPRRQRVLEALLEAAKAAGDDDAIVRHTQALLAVTEDRQAKRELLETVATIHRDRRNDPQRAIAAYRAALEVWPDERSIMHRLLELLTETKQWKASVQLLVRLAELTEPGSRGPYYVAAGNILAEELGAPGEAVEAFERALDADPGDLKSFERVDQLVTAARDWKTQARSYRRQIKRMGADVAPDKRPALLALWRGLGEIYRTRLKDYPAALAAFEVAAGLEPGSIELRRILAELYRLAGPETYPKAVAEERAVLERAPTTAEKAINLKTMLRLYVEMGALDEAHAVSAVLALIGKAEGDERALYEQYRPRGVVRAQGRLNEDLWQRFLYHPDEDKPLSQLLATLSPVVSLARARAPRDIGLKRKQQRDINNDPSVVCRAFAYGSAVFGMPPPEIYFAPESPGEVEVANIRGTLSGTPALLIGKRLLDATSDLEVAFVVGRTLAAVRSDHLLRWPTFVPTLLELEIALRAAAHVVDASLPIPADMTAEVQKYGTFLERTLSPQLREQLTGAQRRWRAAHPDDADDLRAHLGRWSRAAFLTTVRAGFLLSGDLEVADRLGEAVAAAGGVDPADVGRDLATFGVSDAYFELRAALGLRTVNVAFRG